MPLSLPQASQRGAFPERQIRLDLKIVPHTKLYSTLSPPHALHTRYTLAPEQLNREKESRIVERLAPLQRHASAAPFSSLSPSQPARTYRKIRETDLEEIGNCTGRRARATALTKKRETRGGGGGGGEVLAGDF